MWYDMQAFSIGEYMQLTEHFSIEELTASETAGRLGIDNTPPASVVTTLQATATKMEAVRTLLGGLPIHVNSGYRCPALNKAVGGAETSAHLSGDAVDFICPAYGTPLQICQAIANSMLVFDQVIQEGTWCHVSFAPTERHQLLTAQFNPGESTTYKQGV